MLPRGFRSRCMWRWWRRSWRRRSSVMHHTFPLRSTHGRNRRQSRRTRKAETHVRPAARGRHIQTAGAGPRSGAGRGALSRAERLRARPRAVELSDGAWERAAGRVAERLSALRPWIRHRVSVAVEQTGFPAESGKRFDILRGCHEDCPWRLWGASALHCLFCFLTHPRRVRPASAGR